MDPSQNERSWARVPLTCNNRVCPLEGRLVAFPRIIPLLSLPPKANFHLSEANANSFCKVYYLHMLIKKKFSDLAA